jgi:hypothetical protein
MVTPTFFRLFMTVETSSDHLCSQLGHCFLTCRYLIHGDNIYKHVQDILVTCPVSSTRINKRFSQGLTQLPGQGQSQLLPK